jgi:hypothetical protein
LSNRHVTDLVKAWRQNAYKESGTRAHFLPYSCTNVKTGLYHVNGLFDTYTLSEYSAKGANHDSSSSLHSCSTWKGPRNRPECRSFSHGMRQMHMDAKRPDGASSSAQWQVVLRPCAFSMAVTSSSMQSNCGPLDIQDGIKDRLSIKYFDPNCRCYEFPSCWAGCGGTLEDFAGFYSWAGQANSHSREMLTASPWPDSAARSTSIQVSWRIGAI